MNSSLITNKEIVAGVIANMEGWKHMSLVWLSQKNVAEGRGGEAGEMSQDQLFITHVEMTLFLFTDGTTERLPLVTSSVMESWMEPLGPELKQELEVGRKEEFLLLLHFHIFLDGLSSSFLEFLGLGKSPLVHF